MLKKRMTEIEKGDILFRNETNEECEVQGYCASGKPAFASNAYEVFIFTGFSVSKKLMWQFFKNFDGKFYVKRTV